MKDIFIISTISVILLGGLLLYRGEAILNTFLTASLVEQVDIKEDFSRNNVENEDRDLFQLREDDYVLGSLRAQNKVVIFSNPTEKSLRKVFLENILEDVRNEKTYVIWRHLFSSKQDEHFALAMECAGEQDAFWSYLITMYEESIRDSEEVANLIDIDYSKFQRCMQEERYLSKIKEESSLAREEGLYEAPEIFINDRRLPIQTVRDILSL